MLLHPLQYSALQRLEEIQFDVKEEEEELPSFVLNSIFYLLDYFKFNNINNTKIAISQIVNKIYRSTKSQ